MLSLSVLQTLHDDIRILKTIMQSALPSSPDSSSIWQPTYFFLVDAPPRTPSMYLSTVVPVKLVVASCTNRNTF